TCCRRGRRGRPESQADDGTKKITGLASPVPSAVLAPNVARSLLYFANRKFMKLAFVVPWFGAGIPGGAETACRLTAAKLREAGVPVEVLTTCIREFRSDW